ncbi:MULTISPECIES: serine/threonine-protein kinase [unclassified Streptomyces]|uniref:serine/threonine-protein kinase n=1 Tax=unclassified Streptomyces TaxID=2593676 RepID=UPI00224D239A|nr:MULTISPECIES: serine/threonine-protein kinase [unclassified Streptomyces]MCX4400131.1 serine/threonine protein kinase [Streptomyces sp. NBC_01767]MCX5505519.1 serine/threonine protein kinase [Streptomyces sp. NBC_00052]
MLGGRYRLIEPIGAGGFGQVWKAHDLNVDRLVAIKVLTGDAGDRQVARFAREAAVAGGLAHPSIVTVHDFGSAPTHDGQTCVYLVMELLVGHPLSAALERGRLSLPKALYVAACVVDALKAAHGAGLTHRDIKPSNIMIRSNGRATVVDFGITKGNDGRHDVTTPASWSAPRPTWHPKRWPEPSSSAPTCTRSDACSTRWSPAAGPSPERPGT